jgi:predicted AAA+ superfamily ATPase
MQIAIIISNMHDYIHRSLEKEVKTGLSNTPVTVILGPRQCGKSTLAGHIAEGFKKTTYLDLERPSDISKVQNPEIFFKDKENDLIILDEIHRIPEFFPFLRSEVDRRKRNGQFIILGSASYDLLKQSSETLAGRVRLLELTPFQLREIGNNFSALKKIWLRGGFPRSILMPDEKSSFDWRTDFVRLFLERDIPQLGFNIPALTLNRLWQMCAHSHGQLLNSSQLGESLGLSHTTVRGYLELLAKTFMIRILPPFKSNMKKRLVKSPKIYIRDSGILHSLLRIEDFDALLGHPQCGASWEGFVIENILGFLSRWEGSFYRTSNGVELDLILTGGRKRIAVECKTSASPRPSRGFWKAIEEVKADEAWIIAPIEESYKIKENVTISSLSVFLDSFA